MLIRQMKLSELSDIYEIYGPRYFPPDELKPLSAVTALWEAGLYEAFGLYDRPDGDLLGFACFVHAAGQDRALLDYYAVLEEHRNGGIGGGFLKLLKEQYSALAGIYIETENPDFTVQTEEKVLQSRRIGFYLRNGCSDTGVRSLLFGVHYRILYLACRDEETYAGQSAGFHARALEGIYRAMFTEKLYRTQVEITIKD